MRKVDLSDWPTVAEAAEQLMTSERTVMRHGEKGELEIRKRPREGKKPENVCNPRDLEKLMPAEVHLVEAPKEVAKRPASRELAPTGPGAAELVPAAILDQVEVAVNQIVAHYKKGIEAELAARWSAAQQPVPHRKYWLTIEDAAAVSGLSKLDLRNLCRAGAVVARKSGGWKILRSSLKSEKLALQPVQRRD